MVHKLTIANFIKACKKSGGVQALIAQRLGVSRSAVTQFIQSHPFLIDELESAREEIMDLAESKLYEKINKGDSKDIHFLLERLGAKRGFALKQEISHKVEENVFTRVMKIAQNSDKEKENNDESTSRENP
jgi:predicted transcriptional regulator